MSISELTDIMTRSVEKPGRTARDKKVHALLVEKLFEPIAERLRSVEIEIEKMGAHSSAKPHHISEIQLAVPPHDELIPQLRIALAERKKDVVKPLAYAVGARVVQVEDVKGGPFPPVVRWGIWTDSPHAKDRIGGPFRIIAGMMKWKPEAHTMHSRPANNSARGWMSFLGQERTIEELSEFDTYDALADRIAQDLVGLNNVIRK